MRPPFARDLALIPVAVAVIVTACTSAVVPTNRGPGGGATIEVPSRLVVGTINEVATPSAKLDVKAGSGSNDVRFMTSSPLVALEGSGAGRPLLATELPSQDRGSWTVGPDGTMTTTWNIRPNALWQDGEPVTSQDFVFALMVYQDPDVQVISRSPEVLIDRIDPVDSHTFTIRWKQPYLRANRLLSGELEPLPGHVLAELYDRGDKLGFQNAPFWTGTAFIGEGPYRLADWEKGSKITYRAFDQYFLGRPKIDEIVFQVLADQNTVVAQLLAGTIDVTVGQLLNTQTAAAVRRQWDASGDGHILLSPGSLRQVFAQLDPTRTKQPALLDLRVRRALMYGIDRATLAETVSGGGSPAADSLVVPSDPLFLRAQDTIAKYPYDQRQALSLLAEAGWSRSGSGALRSATGEPFTLDYRVSEVSDNVLEMGIAANDLGALGMNVSQTPYLQVSSTLELDATFPGLVMRPIKSMDVPLGLAEYTTAQCPRTERRFVGINLGCWSNPEFDRLVQFAGTAFDEQERTSATLDALKILTDEVGIIPLSYNVEAIAVRNGLVGPVVRAPVQRGYTWNVYEWYWTQ